MENKYSLRYLLTLMLIASALTCLVLGLTIGRDLGIFNGSFGEVREFAALLRRVDELYIGQYDIGEISDEARRAAVDALGDTWSYYMSAEEYAEYLEFSNNSYIGIGVGVAIDEATGGMAVLYVYKGSAAESAGIVAGDVVIAVDESDITGKTLDETKQLLAREIGDTVELTVIRETGDTVILTAEYARIFTDPVEYEMLEDNIGYIKLSNFDSGAANSFIAALDTLIGQGALSVVFDVRGNGGGRVTEMTRILDYLLPQGEIFVAVGRSGTERTTSSDAEMVDIPAVVLVDSYSFSAAEYFAATLGEYDRAPVVGEQTTGKNRSQVTVELPGGGALHISSGEYLTKNRVSLHDAGGLTPDYELALSDELLFRLLSGTLDKSEDTQLQKAIELLSAG